MIPKLYSLYRRSPFWVRNFIGYLTWPIRLVMVPFRTLRIGGYYMVLDFTDNASFKYYTDRERYELDQMTAFLGSIIHNPGAYVIDIGANYGAFTLAAAQFGRFNIFKEIIAIEPDRKAYHALNQSIEKNCLGHVVQLHQLIVGDREGKETLFVNARSSADNRSHQVTTAPISVLEQYEVPCTTIDRLLSENGILLNSKFVIKMDIQGNEPRAFKGMNKTLTQAEGFILFFEHCPYLIESAGIDIREFISTLENLPVDTIFEVKEESNIVPLDGFEGLVCSFQNVMTLEERKLQGACTSYILCRNMNLDGLSILKEMAGGIR
jgi:FkbM family methyltransferase